MNYAELILSALVVLGWFASVLTVVRAIRAAWAWITNRRPTQTQLALWALADQTDRKRQRSRKRDIFRARVAAYSFFALVPGSFLAVGVSIFEFVWYRSLLLGLLGFAIFFTANILMMLALAEILYVERGYTSRVNTIRYIHGELASWMFGKRKMRDLFNDELENTSER